MGAHIPFLKILQAQKWYDNFFPIEFYTLPVNFSETILKYTEKSIIKFSKIFTLNMC